MVRAVITTAIMTHIHSTPRILAVIAGHWIIVVSAGQLVKGNDTASFPVARDRWGNASNSKVIHPPLALSLLTIRAQSGGLGKACGGGRK